MASVSVTIDSKPATLVKGVIAQPALVKMTTLITNAVPRLRIPALNQIFSARDNVTINGNEVITSSMS